jgi:hypothetical protein
MEQDNGSVEKSPFQSPQYLAAVIAGTPPVASLPSGGVCRKLREYAGVTQMAAAACQVGLSSVTRWESGATCHSRALDHVAYRSLLAAWLRHAQQNDEEFAREIRRQWPTLPKTNNREVA